MSPDDDWARRWPGRREIQELLRHLPALERPSAELFVPPSGLSGALPAGPEPAPEVSDLVGDLYRLGFIRAFAWPDEQDELRALQTDPERLAGADLTDLVKLLTSHVRADRFVDGHLADAVQQGWIAGILRRLAAIDGLLDDAASAQRLIEDREGLASRPR